MGMQLSGSLELTGSLTTSGAIVAQTLVVQTITSSITQMTGSNIFGSSLTNRQQFTGSVLATGSFTVTTTGTELQVNANGVNLGNALTDSHVVSGSFRVNPNGLFVSGSGFVGVGAVTSSIGSRLVVSGSIESLTDQAGEGGQLTLRGNTFQYGIDNYNGTGVRIIRENDGTGAAGSVLMFVSASGNVGIGNATPQGTFHVGSNLTSGGDAAAITLKQTSTTATSGIYLERSGEQKGYYMYVGGSVDSLTFQRNNAGTKADVMSLTRDGNVGIGATNPDGKLEVAGNIKMSGTANAAFFGSIQASWAGSTTYPTLFGANADRWVMHINPHVSYVQNGVNGYTGTTYGAMVRMAADPAANNYWDMGVLSVFGGDRWGISRNTTGLASLTSAGVWSTNGGGTSDARVKQNIEYIETSGLDAIQALKPVKFEFIENPEKKRRGFIAQDVLEVIPDLVLGDGEREGGTYGLDYDGILALAVKAIQELNAKVTALENR